MGLTITPSTIQVQEEGVSQGNVNTVNYVGDATTVTVSGNTATVTSVATSLGLSLMIKQGNYNI